MSGVSRGLSSRGGSGGSGSGSIPGGVAVTHQQPSSSYYNNSSPQSTTTYFSSSSTSPPSSYHYQQRNSAHARDRDSLGSRTANSTVASDDAARTQANKTSPSSRAHRNVVDPVQRARNASLNALVGGSNNSSQNKSPATRSPSSRHRSSSSNAASMESESSHVDIGDTVEVPGGMTGVVKYLGGVKGKNGTFVGVELNRDFAARGKNDGDVDGQRQTRIPRSSSSNVLITSSRNKEVNASSGSTKYFSTNVPGSGIFLPLHRALKQTSPTFSSSTFPPTPTTPGFNNNNNFDDLGKSTNGTAANSNLGAPNNRTPPTPSIQKFSQSAGPGSRPNFSQSIGPGIRAPSPGMKRPLQQPSRQSLPRPESPIRKGGSSIGVAPGQAARGGRSTLGFTPGRSSIGAGRPPSTPSMPRAASRSQSRQSAHSPTAGDETPTATVRSSMGNGLLRRRESNQANSAAAESAANAEIDRLRRSLDERDRQLRDQASSLAEMENSLGELQSLVAANAVTRNSPPRGSPGEDGAPDVSQLRSLLREKNDKIQILTSEFDSHRADFRSTIDALEMASAETERVYEKRVQELLQEVADLSERGDDVENVARNLKQLEDFVAELEEGLEDARRGEAEARSEVEFLRGEVERTRSELRREREKAAKALKGAAGAMNDPSTPHRSSRELEQRDDEIRGLKAIIHSLSSGSEVSTPVADRTGGGFGAAEKEELAKMKEAVATLQREKSELKGMVDRKKFREEELEREVAKYKQQGNASSSGATLNGTTNGTGHGHNSSVASVRTVLRPSSGEVGGPNGTNATNNGPSQNHHGLGSVSRGYGSSRPGTSAGDPLLSPASATFHDANQDFTGGSPSINDTASSVDQQYCDYCDSAEHDILSCTSIGIAQKRASMQPAARINEIQSGNHETVRPLRVMKSAASLAERHRADAERKLEGLVEDSHPSEEDQGTAAGNDKKLQLKDYPEGTPAPGKSSGKVDMSKWCAMCEHEGHESIDCPFEEDY